MMNSAKMMWGCVAVAGVVAILAVARLGSAALLFALPCIAMMGAMVWMMVRMGSGSGDTKRK
jgi:hypothetical protein